MGPTNKLTVEVEGTPMVARVADALFASKVAEIVVVTGHEPRRIETALRGREVTLVHNPDYDDGISTSIRAGISALGEDIDGALIALADMPWLRPEVVDRLLDAFSADGELSIFVPMFGGKRGNPVLWSSIHFPELCTLTGDVGGKRLFHRHSAAVCYANVEDAGVSIDLDTPEALDTLGILRQHEEDA